MSYPKKILLFLLSSLIIASFSACAYAKVYRTKIDSNSLVIKAPKYFYSGPHEITFIDPKQEHGVKLIYKPFEVQANRIVYDTRRSVIELSKGFKGSFGDFHLEGSYFRFNPKTQNYVGEDLKLGYLMAALYGKKFQFYGKRILINDISASPLYPLINLYSQRVEIYPGYTLAYGNNLNLFRIIPFYYVPLYVEDGRRNSFELIIAAPEIKSNTFHGLYGFYNTNFFFNPVLYGTLSLGLSEKDGWGGRVQNLVRLNDHHQFQLQFAGWADNKRLQQLHSYEFNFFSNPRPKRRLTFQKQQKLEEEIKNIPGNPILRVDYTQNEEIQRSIIDRYPDVTLRGSIKSIIRDHTLSIDPSITYGKILEKGYYPEDSESLTEVNIDSKRLRYDLNVAYFLEMPYVKKSLLAMDYEHSEYEPQNSNRGRVSSSLTFRRPISKLIGLFYNLTLTKVLLDYGQSPFEFERYGRLGDSGYLDLYLQLQLLILGYELVYDFSSWQPFNNIYYAGIRYMDRYAVIKYDTREKWWEFQFMVKAEMF
ncbi:MAG: hypothetical protein V3T21_04220 [Candidatus Margulisiibacteriota bacterium]